MSDPSLFDRARGFLQHAETHLERRNYGAVSEAHADLRALFAEMERKLDPRERERLRVLPGGRR